jgi:hypothetical protein
MKNWEFWLLLGISVVTLFITVKIGMGLQNAQDSLTRFTSPVQGLLSRIGL